MYILHISHISYNLCIVKFVTWITFCLQIVQAGRFEMPLQPEKALLNVWVSQQILSIALEFTCVSIYITSAMLKNCTDFVYLALQPKWTLKHHKLYLKVCFMGMEYRKQSGWVSLIKVQPETWSSSTGRGLPMFDNYDQGVLEWSLSGKIYIRGPHA